MKEAENKIICDNCHCEISKAKIELKDKEVKIAGSKIGIQYFKCPTCNKPYLTIVENYTVRKKKEKYDLIMRSINRKRKYGIKVSEGRLKEAIELKDDLISYEMQLRDRYRSLIPREAFED